MSFVFAQTAFLGNIRVALGSCTLLFYLEDSCLEDSNFANQV